MNYYLYETDKNKKVRVHTGSCMYCKEGKGMKSVPHSDSGWHGPFETLSAAQDMAKSLAIKDTRNCATCLDGKRF